MSGTDASQTTLWAKDEAKRLANERAEKMKEKGFRDFYSWRKGENHFQVVLTEPTREIDGKYGKQKIFAAESGGAVFDLAINVRSPVYRIVVNGLAAEKTKFNILKSGDGKDTKYELLEASE